MRISDWSSDVCSSDLKHRVVIGKDTRLSGYMIENALVAGFTSVGIVDRQHRAVDRTAGDQPARARPGPDLGLELADGGQRRARESVGQGKRVAARVELGRGRLIQQKKQQKGRK